VFNKIWNESAAVKQDIARLSYVFCLFRHWPEMNYWFSVHSWW